MLKCAQIRNVQLYVVTYELQLFLSYLGCDRHEILIPSLMQLFLVALFTVRVNVLTIGNGPILLEMDMDEMLFVLVWLSLTLYDNGLLVRKTEMPGIVVSWWWVNLPRLLLLVAAAATSCVALVVVDLTIVCAQSRYIGRSVRRTSARNAGSKKVVLIADRVWLLCVVLT